MYDMPEYISLTFLLKTILLLTIVIVCYYCIKHPSKQKDLLQISNINMESTNELAEIDIKIFHFNILMI